MIWKSVPGFSFLEASDSGLIRTLDRTDLVVQKNRTFYQFRKGRILKPIVHKGRPKVNVSSKNGSHYQTLTGIGVLVCLAFHGDRPADRPWALHKDDNPSNNVAGNLYWGSPADNAKDRALNGLTPRGSSHWSTTLTEAQVTEIKIRHKAKTKLNGSFALGLEYGVHRTTIENIVKGRTWK